MTSQKNLSGSSNLQHINIPFIHVFTHVVYVTETMHYLYPFEMLSSLHCVAKVCKFSIEIR